MKILVFRKAPERATYTPRLGMSEGGEDTKEDGAEDSEDEIHIEKARGLRFGEVKSLGGFMVRLPPRNGLCKLTSDMA